MILSTRTQATIIAALLDGRPVDVNPRDLREPWLEYYEWIHDGPADETPAQRWGAFAQEFLPVADEHKTAYNLMVAIKDDPNPYLAVEQRLATLPPLRWLWPRWIPRGLISLLAAVPGTGKSYLALDLCRRIAAGSAFPDGTHIGSPANALYIDAENTPQILKGRVGAWEKHERERLFLMLPHADKMMINLSEADDRDRLLDIVWHVRPDLVVIDSYGSISLKGENAKEDVQSILAYFARLALDYDCGLLIVHHLRKRATIQLNLPGIPMTLDDIRGSSHIPAMARNVLGLQWIGSGDADRNGPRRLQVLKSNLDRYPEPIGVWFDPHPMDSSVALLRYGEAPEAGGSSSLLEQCAAWLLEVLDEGPLPPAEVVQLAAQECYSERTVYRARKHLGDAIHDTAGRRSPTNQWTLSPTDGESDCYEDDT